MLNLYNTLSRKIEPFEPIGNPVGMYTCGPTVYYFAHIGNLRTYFFEDTLKRVLYYNGYKVNHVMNVTDVGHLTSDADTGEDKIEKAAKETHKSAWEIAEYYTKAFFQDLENLNIIKPDIIARATDHIPEDIELIKALEEKGYTYKTSDGIYFDTSKFGNYGQLTGMNFEKLSKNLKSGVRIELSPEKKNITDFSLWKFSPPGAERQMEWDSPWGKGCPGWHIECSAINLKYLADAFKDNKFYPQSAKTIDIHTGGMDHIPIHHTNEIAQVEAATNKQFVKYWLHSTFLVLKKGRMGKSEGNSINLSDLIEKGFEPMAYRYFLLNAQYRTALEFDLEGLEAAKNSLASLKNSLSTIKKANASGSSDLSSYKEQFLSAINDDLNTPQALAVLWKLIKDFNKNPEDFNSQEVYNFILDFDKIFGLKLDEVIDEPVPEEILKLAHERENMRQDKKYDEADEIRKKVESMGYKIEDSSKGIKVKHQ